MHIQCCISSSVMSYEVLAGCKLHMAQLMSLSSQNLIRNQNGFTFIVPDFSGRLWKVTINTHTHTHTHTCNSSFSKNTRYQKGKTNQGVTEARDSEWQWHRWVICKCAPHSRQITMPAPPHHSVFYRPDALPDAQPTASKHWRHKETIKWVFYP